MLPLLRTRTLSTSLPPPIQTHPVHPLKRLQEALGRFHRAGDVLAARAQADLCLSAAKEEFGETHVVVAGALSDKALMVKEAGDVQGAVELYKQSVDLYETNERRTNSKTLSKIVVMVNLGNALRAKARDEKDQRKRFQVLDEAKLVLEDASFHLPPQVKNTASPLQLSILKSLANLHKELENVSLAEELLRKVLEATTNNAMTFESAAAKNDLALVLKIKGNSFDEARELYQDAIRVTERRLGPAAKDTVVYKHNLAELLETRDETKDEAQQIRQDILDAIRKRSGENA